MKQSLTRFVCQLLNVSFRTGKRRSLARYGQWIDCGQTLSLWNVCVCGRTLLTGWREFWRISRTLRLSLLKSIYECVAVVDQARAFPLLLESDEHFGVSSSPSFAVNACEGTKARPWMGCRFTLRS